MRLVDDDGEPVGPGVFAEHAGGLQTRRPKVASGGEGELIENQSSQRVTGPLPYVNNATPGPNLAGEA